MLEIKNCSYYYKKDLATLNNINLTIKKGDFFGLLGENGAGKTTLINLINTMLHLQTGQILLDNNQAKTNPKEFKRTIGWVPQEFNFNNFQTLEFMLLNNAGYYGISAKEIYPRMQSLMQALGLWDRRHMKIYQLSGGLKRRLMIVRALLHRPSILLLDEPTAGVDVAMREKAWDFLKEINQQEKVTILLTTHYLEEVENLCKNVAVLHKGGIIKSGSLSTLLKDSSQEATFMQISGNFPKTIEANSLQSYCPNTGVLTFFVNNSTLISTVISELLEQNIVISRIWTESNRLKNLLKKWTNQ